LGYNRKTRNRTCNKRLTSRLFVYVRNFTCKSFVGAQEDELFEEIIESELNKIMV